MEEEEEKREVRSEKKMIETGKMEKVKRVLNKFFFNKDPDHQEDQLDQIITINDVSEGTKKKKKRAGKTIPYAKLCIVIDILFRCFVCILWALLFAFFMSSAPIYKRDFRGYVYLGCFMIVLIVSVISIMFDLIFVKIMNKFGLRMVVMMNEKQKRSHFLRIRVAGEKDKEYIEVEVEPDSLTYDNILELCCTELNVEKRETTRIRKVPGTKIRGDADVKNFRRVEFLELVS